MHLYIRVNAVMAAFSVGWFVWTSGQSFSPDRKLAELAVISGVYYSPTHTHTHTLPGVQGDGQAP